MALQISPFGNSQFLTTGGVPASGYQLFVYAGRSAVKRTVYSDADGLGKHPNPITLDANGFAPAPIYLDTTLTYKFVLAAEFDDDPPTVPLYQVDQVSVGLETPTTATAEWITGTTPTYLSASSFSVAGDQRTTYHVGRRIKAVTGAGSLYGTITASTFGAATTVTVLLDLGTLDNTLSAIFYSFLSAAGSAWPGGYSTGLTTTFTGPVVMPVTSSFNLLAAGNVFPYAGSAAPPAGYLLCNGATVSRTTYAALFAAIGTVFGAGDGVTTFAVPTIADLTTNVKYIIRYA